MDNKTFKYLLLLLPLSTGCAEQAYDRGQKSSVEMAVIKNSYTSTGGLKSVRAEILGVDDDYFDGSAPRRVEVVPGQHSVVVRCRRGRLITEQSTGLQNRQGSVQFVAKAGREYQVLCSVERGGYLKWIADLTTDEIVGGEKPSTYQ